MGKNLEELGRIEPPGALSTTLISTVPAALFLSRSGIPAIWIAAA